MTENEAREILVRSQGCCGNSCNHCKEAHNMAIQALETIQKLKERKFTLEILENYMLFEDECVKKGYAFKSILEARERMEPLDPIRNDKCTCPKCGTHNEIIKKRRNTVAFDTVYCWHCGQAMEIKRD